MKIMVGSYALWQLIKNCSPSLELLPFFRDDVPGEQESVDMLRQNTDFLKYILNVILQKLQQIQEKGQCDGAESKDKTKLFKYCCTMGR